MHATWPAPAQRHPSWFAAFGGLLVGAALMFGLLLVLDRVELGPTTTTEQAEAAVPWNTLTDHRREEIGAIKPSAMTVDAYREFRLGEIRAGMPAVDAFREFRLGEINAAKE